MIGIYGIVSKRSNKIYIGKTTDFAHRRIRHNYLLKANKHFNKHLQRTYNKYGKEDLEFVMLQECTTQELTTEEQKWVNLNIHRLLNHVKDVIKLCGPENPFFGHKHTDNTKIKMRAAKVGKYNGVNNPNFGKKSSLETKIKIATRNSGTKLSINDVLKIKKLLLDGELLDVEIAELFGVSRTVVTRIAKGQRWSNITGGAVIPTERRGKRIKVI